MASARLFVALELPAAVRAALGQWARAVVVPAADGARALPEASLHVTLCFLGSVALEEMEPLAAALDSVGPVGAVGAVPLRAGEVVWLPPRRPRVCAVGLTDRSGAGRALQAAVAARLAAGGWYAPDARPFLAHVSVARLRAGVRGSGVGVPAVVAPSLAPFGASALVLYRSWPGSRYEALARVALPAPA